MEQEFLMKIANEINRQIRCGVTADVIMSWGVSKRIAKNDIRFILLKSPLFIFFHSHSDLLFAKLQNSLEKVPYFSVKYI
jgi:hypothetical protein